MTFSCAQKASRSLQSCYRTQYSSNLIRYNSSSYATFSSTTRPQQTPSKPASSTTTPTSSMPSTPSTPSTSSTTSTTRPAKPPPPPTSSPPKPIPDPETRSLTSGLDDEPLILREDEKQVDWSRSFHGLSSSPFSAEQAAILLEPVDPEDIEIKPDGIIYLPEIKYRRILTRAFGPGGWGLAPRGETIVTSKSVTREYGLVVGGRLVSIARGEQQYFDPEGIPTATEGCKSNALMRCCKDLGIASELWDPRYIRKYMTKYAKETFVEHVVTKKRRKHIMRKDDVIKYPFKEVKMGGTSGAFN